MNMLFYYDEIFNAAIERINKLVNISGRLIRQEDIDEVTHKSTFSLGNILCPDAAAEYAGVSKLLELDMQED